MPHPSSPWFRISKVTWYVPLDGRKESLCVCGRANRTAALVAFADLLAERTPAPRTPTPATGLAPSLPSSPTVAGLVERFLAAAGARLKPASVFRYRSDAGFLVRRFGPKRRPAHGRRPRRAASRKRSLRLRLLVRERYWPRSLMSAARLDKLIEQCGPGD